MSDRRTFLRGLASLPLIGGSVASLGQPTKAAVPITDALHTRYLAWLAHEHRAAVREHAFRSAVASWVPHPGNYESSAIEYAMRATSRTQDYIYWYPDIPQHCEDGRGNRSIDPCGHRAQRGRVFADLNDQPGAHSIGFDSFACRAYFLSSLGLSFGVSAVLSDVVRTTHGLIFPSRLAS